MPDAPAHDTWSVLVMDLYHYMDPDEETVVSGFASWDEARAYARARTWSSVEELRKPGMSAEELKHAWWSFGETALVIGAPHYSATDEIDYFVANQASPEQIEWTTPSRRAPVARESPMSMSESDARRIAQDWLAQDVGPECVPWPGGTYGAFGPPGEYFVFPYLPARLGHVVCGSFFVAVHKTSGKVYDLGCVGD